MCILSNIWEIILHKNMRAARLLLSHSFNTHFYQCSLKKSSWDRSVFFFFPCVNWRWIRTKYGWDSLMWKVSSTPTLHPPTPNPPYQWDRGSWRRWRQLCKIYTSFIQLSRNLFIGAFVSVCVGLYTWFIFLLDFSLFIWNFLYIWDANPLFVLYLMNIFFQWVPCFLICLTL